MDKEAATLAPPSLKEQVVGLDLAALREQALADIRSGKKTRRAKGVKILRAVSGMERAGVEPKDLFTKRVPVIPAAFRPFSVAGDTFIPGDANELYSDLFKARKIYSQAREHLGATGAQAALQAAGLRRAQRHLSGSRAGNG